MSSLPRLLFVLLAVAAVASPASAQYAWSDPQTGNWSNGANWLDSAPSAGGSTLDTFSFRASGSGTYTSTNDFAGTYLLNQMSFDNRGTGTITVAGNAFSLSGSNPTLSLAATDTGAVVVSAPITLGANATISNNGTGLLTVSGAVTGGASTLSVGGAGNVTFSGTVSGTGTITKSGTGTVIFTAANALGSSGNVGTRNVVVNAGTLQFATQSFGRSTTLTIAAGAVAQSSGTLNLGVVGNGSNNSTNISGAGTLRLVGTANSAVSPDIYFGPDHSGNSYYGATIAVATLDLGTTQRFISAQTGHNSISNYYPNNDARITSSIIGSGGVTYTAQNTFSGQAPQLALAGANTFTGRLEIQAGSVYLLNSQALIQGNKLLLNASSSNAVTFSRFFLYGQNATVSNLESSGTGTSQIANANVVNNASAYAAGSPLSTLFVNQTTATTFAGTLADSIAEYDSTSGNPSGALALTLKAGSTGTLTLSGNNSYTGATTINGGKLSVSSVAIGGVNSNLGASSSAASNLVFGGGTLQYTGAAGATDRGFTLGSAGGTVEVTGPSLSFSGQVTGAGNLTKTGTGTLALLGTASDYTGNVNVAAGTLIVRPNASTAAYSVASGATLSVSTPDVPATLTATAATFANNSTLNFSYNAAGNPSAPFLNVTGANGLSVATGGTVQIGLNNPSGFALGSFSLINYSGTIGGAGFGGFTLAPSRYTLALVNNVPNNSIDVSVTALAEAIRWTGTVNGTWDVGTGVNVGGTNNWKLANAGSITNYVLGDTVIFDDTASTFSLNLATNVAPTAITVNNSSNTYTFSGAGGLTGGASLTKSGTGTLVLATNNSYTGGTTISGGTVQVGTGGTTGAIVGNVTNNGALVFNRSDAVAFSGVISGTGSVAQIGSGTLTLSGANTYSGPTTVTGGGTLSVGSDSNLGTAPATPTAAQLVLNNGTLTASAGFTLNANRGLALGPTSGSGGGTINVATGTLSYAGVIADNGGSGSLTKTGAGTLDLNGTSTYTGGTTVLGGAVTFTNGSAFGTGPITFGAGVTGTAGASGSPPTAFLNNTTASDTTLANNLVLMAPTTATTYTIQKTGSGGQINFTGNISGGNANTKLFLNSSTGGDNTTTYRFAGNNSFVATVEVWRGAMIVASASGLGNASNLIRFNSNNNTTLGDLRFETSGTFANPIEFVTGGGGPVNTNANNVTLSGVLSGGYSGGLTKLGSGALTVTGSNTYTAGTTVSAGTLLVSNTSGSGTGTGAVTVANGATLGGTGTITGTTTVQSGGTIRGDTGTGTGTLTTGIVNINSGATLAANIGANGTNNQLAVGTNSLNLFTGSRVSLTAVSGFNGSNSTYTLATLSNGSNLTLDGVGQADGTIIGWYVQGSGATGAVVIDVSNLGVSLATGDTFKLTASSNNLVLTFTPVPEPATVLAVGAAGLGLLGWIRRRKIS